MLRVLIRIALPRRFLWVSTTCFDGELTKTILQLSSNTLLICSSESDVMQTYAKDWRKKKESNIRPVYKEIWASTWQNQQNECAPSEDSDQPRHPPSLISVFAVRMKKAWVLSYPLSAQRMPRVTWVFAGCTLICWFCHVTAHITFDILILILTWIFDTTFSGLTVGGDWYFSFCTASSASATIGCAHFIRIVIWNTWKVWQIDQAWGEKLTMKSVTRKKVSRDMTKPTKWVCAQRRLGSAWASAQSDQGLRCPLKESLGP